MHTTVLVSIMHFFSENAPSGLRPHTPRRAPYLQYGCALFVLSLSALLCSCATSNAREKAQNTLESYISSCTSNRTQQAKKLISPHLNQEQVCPDESITKHIATNQNLIFIAKTNDHKLTDDGQGWKLDLRRLMTDNTPEATLHRLRDALQNHDDQALKQLIAPKTLLNEDFATFTQKNASKFNALYAAISATARPWFQMEGNQALCDVSGILLTFEVHNGRWYWKPTF